MAGGKRKAAMVVWMRFGSWKAEMKDFQKYEREENPVMQRGGPAEEHNFEEDCTVGLGKERREREGKGERERG